MPYTVECVGSPCIEVGSWEMIEEWTVYDLFVIFNDFNMNLLLQP